MKISVYTAEKNGEVHLWSTSRAELDCRLHGSWLFNEAESDQWTVRQVECEARSVRGQTYAVHDDHGVYPHIMWECPACGHTHVEDIAVTAKTPHLGGCQSNEDIWQGFVLIEFEEGELNTAIATADAERVSEGPPGVQPVIGNSLKQNGESEHEPAGDAQKRA